MKFTIKDISEYLSVSEEQVRRWCRNGKLNAVKCSKKEGYIIEELDLESLLGLFSFRVKCSRLYEEVIDMTDYEKALDDISDLIVDMIISGADREDIKKEVLKSIEIIDELKKNK